MTEFSVLSRLLAATVVLLAVSGCASNDAAKNSGDPYENMNRKFYTFNDTLDKHFVEPVAKKYAQYTPDRSPFGRPPRTPINKVLKPTASRSGCFGRVAPSVGGVASGSCAFTAVS